MLRGALPLLLLSLACGGLPPPSFSSDVPPQPDGGSEVPAPDGGVPIDSGVLTFPDAGLADGGVEAFVLPVYFATADQPMPSGGLAALDHLYGAVRARLREETQLDARLAPATSHTSARSCGSLGANANAIAAAVAQELSPPPHLKLQVLLPCGDPTNQAAGVAYVGGEVAVVFDPGRSLGSSGSHSTLSTVAMHELGHNLGLVHNSVGANCMGGWEELSVAQLLLGQTDTAPCVLLPHQRAEALSRSRRWLVEVAPVSFGGSAPSLLATRSTLGARRVELTWVGGAPSGATGWHIVRDGRRILRVAATAAKQASDADGANEYHSDPSMADPGLAAGQRYCYRLRAHDGDGNEGPEGPETCVTL